jgi:hypothetical protein
MVKSAETNELAEACESRTLTLNESQQMMTLPASAQFQLESGRKSLVLAVSVPVMAIELKNPILSLADSTPLAPLLAQTHGNRPDFGLQLD